MKPKHHKAKFSWRQNNFCQNIYTSKSWRQNVSAETSYIIAQYLDKSSRPVGSLQAQCHIEEDLYIAAGSQLWHGDAIV